MKTKIRKLYSPDISVLSLSAKELESNLKRVAVISFDSKKSDHYFTIAEINHAWIKVIKNKGGLVNEK